MRLPARRRLYAIVLFFLLITSLQQLLQAGASTAPPPAHGGPDLGLGDWVGMATTDATWADYTVDVHFTIVKEAASVYFRTQGGAASSICGRST